MEFIRPFITANTIYSEEATIEARNKARSSVQPVTRSFVQGETVIDHGRIITQADIEALGNLGMLKPETRIEDILSAFSIVTLFTVFIALFFKRR